MSVKVDNLTGYAQRIGFVGVRIWWEPIGKANEMCGSTGGWFMDADGDNFALGYDHKEAFETLDKMGRLKAQEGKK